MSIATVFEIVLAAVVLGLAVWTIAVFDTYSATVGFVAYGLLVALIWVRIDAVDVALTEAAIGGGLGGVLLLSAAARLRATAAVTVERSSRTSRLCAGVLSASITAALGAAILDLPAAAPTLAPLAVANAGATGLGNAVTNVLMAFRGMDTMLEKVVLLLAIVGVWSLAADEPGAVVPACATQADPDGARLSCPPAAARGHRGRRLHRMDRGGHPGGAFQGGRSAAMWLLVMMAGLRTPHASAACGYGRSGGGPAPFLLVGLVGIGVGREFLSYPPRWPSR